LAVCPLERSSKLPREYGAYSIEFEPLKTSPTRRAYGENSFPPNFPTFAVHVARYLIKKDAMRKTVKNYKKNMCVRLDVKEYF